MKCNLTEEEIEESVAEVMRATGCSYKTARREFLKAERQVRKAEKMLLDAIGVGSISATGINTRTGKREIIPRGRYKLVREDE